MKKSFLMYIDSLDVLEELSDEEAGQLFKAVRAFHQNQDVELSPMVRVAFSAFKNHFVRDQQKYSDICEKRRVAGAAGGNQKQANVASATKCKQGQANLADSVSGNDSDSDSDNKAKKEKTKRFAPPSLGELKAYIKEKNLNVGAETFINHYETNGWRVGKNKMVSWKHAAANWSKRNNEQNKDERESSEKVWSDSATGIRGKGKEVGLRESDFDNFPQFKNAVSAEVRRLESIGDK